MAILNKERPYDAKLVQSNLIKASHIKLDWLRPKQILIPNKANANH